MTSPHRNGAASGGRGALRLIAPSASAEEAAAIVAALEDFRRATAIHAADEPRQLDGWHRAALLEGVERESALDDLPSLWINT